MRYSLELQELHENYAVWRYFINSVRYSDDTGGVSHSTRRM